MAKIFCGFANFYLIRITYLLWPHSGHLPVFVRSNRHAAIGYDALLIRLHIMTEPVSLPAFILCIVNLGKHRLDCRHLFNTPGNVAARRDHAMRYPMTQSGRAGSFENGNGCLGVW